MLSLEAPGTRLCTGLRETVLSSPQSCPTQRSRALGYLSITPVNHGLLAALTHSLACLVYGLTMLLAQEHP